MKDPHADRLAKCIKIAKTFPAYRARSESFYTVSPRVRPITIADLVEGDLLTFDYATAEFGSPTKLAGAKKRKARRIGVAKATKAA